MTTAHNQLAQRVYQTLLDEHAGNASLALLDLAGRFVRQADGVAAGFVRYPPHKEAPRPPKPAPPAILDPEDDGA